MIHKNVLAKVIATVVVLVMSIGSLLLCGAMIGGNTEWKLSATTSEVEIVTSSSYRDTLGYLHIVGEVVNNSDSNVEYVKVVATYYDQQGDVIGTEFDYTELDILVPSQKSPFDVNSYPDLLPALDRYIIQLQYQNTPAEPFSGLVILSHTSSTDPSGNYYAIVGEVQNTSGTTCEFIKVVATYYDSLGTVIGANYAYTQLDELAPGQTSSFEINSYPRIIAPATDSVQVQGRASTPTPTPTPTSAGHRHIPLNQGWNLMSLPLVPSDSDIGVLLAGIANNVISVWSYDSNKPGNPWTSWAPVLGGDLTEMIDCRGYWVKMRVADTLTVWGSPGLE